MTARSSSPRARRPTTPTRRAPRGAGVRLWVRQRWTRCPSHWRGPTPPSRPGPSGLPASVLAPLAGGTVPEQDRARAFNEALWETHLGRCAGGGHRGRANDPQHRLDWPMLDAIHDQWVGHVRGRGPVPALRLGRQPYGLLPIMSTDAGTYRPVRGDRAETQVVPFVVRQRQFWEEAARDVPTVMNRALDDAIPQILGTDAVLRGLRVRTQLDAEVMKSVAVDTRSSSGRSSASRPSPRWSPCCPGSTTTSSRATASPARRHAAWHCRWSTRATPGSSTTCCSRPPRRPSR